MVGNNDLFGDLPRMDIRFADTNDEAGGNVGIDPTSNGDQGDDRECDEADLPYTSKPDGKPGDEPAHVVHEVASLQMCASARVSKAQIISC